MEWLEPEAEFAAFRSWCEKNRPFLYKDRVWVCNKAAVVIRAALDAAYRGGMGREDAVRHVTNWIIARLEEIGIDPFDVDKCDFQGLRDDVREVLGRVFPRAVQAGANPLIRWKTRTPLREPRVEVVVEETSGPRLHGVPVRVSVPARPASVAGAPERVRLAANLLVFLASVLLFYALAVNPRMTALGLLGLVTTYFVARKLKKGEDWAWLAAVLLFALPLPFVIVFAFLVDPLYALLAVGPAVGIAFLLDRESRAFCGVLHDSGESVVSPRHAADNTEVPLGSGVSEASAGRVCPTCGLPATYINSLNKFYCFNCKKYVE
ncbi:hypothetical protein IG193_07780 [Infirmifilum lucidum]|uniref:Uncharacterized protein n=1 Tax=Infirmifilum lucidum TaxID=2776706 RepID=A0A7L9FIN9_9CREN|nr:hypothetical protein [Infirmifilum lucidum]QOJ78645.1 hypothetical protein IG193_07780 [Infirmifilum lucidum]